MRTHVRHDGVVEHDRRVAEVLGLAEMIDVAPLIAAEARGVPSCAGTCPDYGRIDQFWVTRPLAPAVIDCQLLTEPVGASDHHGVAISIDTDQILSHESWEYH